MGSKTENPRMLSSRRFRFAAGAVLLAACATAAVATREGAAPAAVGPPFAVREKIEGIDRFACVAPGIYRGAQPSSAGLLELKKRGIKTIINFRRHHSERAAAIALGLHVEEIPFEAGLLGSEAPTAAQVSRFLSIVQSDEARPVFFHCATGADRTGTMAAIYRLEVQGWSHERAIAEMQDFGYHDIYKDLIQFVRDYKPASPK